MGENTYRKLVWALVGAVIGMILFVPSLWLGDVILGGMLGFGACYGIAALVQRRRSSNAEATG